MSALLSATKRSALIAEVLTNPEVDTSDETFVGTLVDRAVQHVTRRIQYPRYPELVQGYSRSAASPTADLNAESLATNEFSVAVNGSSLYAVSITLANCTTGLLTAAEVQTQIRAVSSDYGLDEVTVEYNSDDASNPYYEIKSARYGESSTVYVAFDETAKDVAKEMKLSLTYGGTEEAGMAARAEADSVVTGLAEVLYRKIGVEGMKSGSLPGDISFAEHDLDPTLMSTMYGMRRV